MRGEPVFACPKTPRGTKVVEKILKQRKAVAMDRSEKEAVRKRDQESCRVCFRKSREVHERLFKSLGGVASLVNSMVVCKLCHKLLQGHAIKVFGQTCNDPLKFAMTQAVAHLVFRGKAVAPHVEVHG